MIYVTIKESLDEKIRAVEVRGHAGYAEHGQDIVCAAVSAVTIGAVNSVDKLLGIDLEATVDEEQGLLQWEVPEQQAETSDLQLQLLMRMMIETLQMIENEYNEFIKIKIESSL